MFNLQYVSYYSTAITAGHCVCGKTDGLGEYCDVGKDRNQIDVPNNVIRTEIYLSHRWLFIPLVTIERAYVMYFQLGKENCKECIYPSPKNPSCTQSCEDQFFHDLGIIQPRIGTIFRHRAVLNFIVPLCLPAENAQIPTQYSSDGKDAIITTVGNGIQYNEVPDGKDSKWNPDSRNPRFTSCTTSQLGNTNHDATVETKFKKCKIEFLKNNVVKNGWRGCRKCPRIGCSKTDLPVGYEFDKCTDYWVQAKKAVKKNGPVKTEKFKKINKIKISEACGISEPECLKWDVFINHGWCEVDGGTLDDWGICDHSCNHVEVLNLHLYQHYYFICFIS